MFLAFIQVTNQTLELLVQNLARMDEKEETDRQGVFHTLGKYTRTTILFLSTTFTVQVSSKTFLGPVRHLPKP